MERAVAIEIVAHPMGGDWVFLVYGGKAHIGASVAAYPDKEAVVVNTISLPGHREEQLAAELASYAASQLQRTVAVLMGIHIDQADRQEIAEIMAVTRRQMNELILNLQSGSSTPGRIAPGIL